MKLIEEEKNKKIFLDGNKKYIVYNMGEYIGHKHRSRFDKVDERWVLMCFKEKCENGEVRAIDALIDDNGNYITIKIENESVSRVVSITNQRVIDDRIYGETGDDYIASRTESFPLLEKYLDSEQVFTSIDGEIYNSEVCDNTLIKVFLTDNEKIGKVLNATTRR